MSVLLAVLSTCSAVEPSPVAVRPEIEAPARLERVELDADMYGERRSYWVHVPGGAARARPLPAVFVFHGGRGSNGRAAMAPHWTNVFAEPVIVVFPNGQLRDRDRGGWDDPEGTGFQVDVVRGMVADVVARFGADPRHVYAVGLSSGGHVVNQLACAAGSTFAGFGRTGRTLLAATRDGCATPTDAPQIMILGTEDRSARMEGKRDPASGAPHELPARDAWAFWLDAAGCAGEAHVDLLPDRGDPCRVEVKTHLGCRDTPAMRYVHVVGGPHEWSGPGGGSVCRDLDTTEEFLRFFEVHAGLVRR